MKAKILLLFLSSFCCLQWFGFQSSLFAQTTTISLVNKVIDESPNNESIVGNDLIIRSHMITLNDIEASKSIQLNLFSDIDLVANLVAIDRHKNGATVWRGAIENQKWGYTLISQYNSTYWIKVELDDGRIFQIQPVASNLSEGQYLLSEVNRVEDDQDFDCEKESEELFQPNSPDNNARQKLMSVCDVAADCSGKVVHIMVVYTPAASQYFNGAAGTESAIAMAVSEMNTINTNSGVNHTFNLIRTQEIDYTEDSGSTDFSRLWKADDGYIDEVHAWRNQYGADVVSMVTTSACGLASVNTNPTNYSSSVAFSIVGTGCMVTNKTLAHEVGHNMGLRHDRYAYGNSLPSVACDWAWGFVNPNGLGGTTDQQWRTVMAYGDYCFDNGFSCGRIPHWSNPDIVYNGDPTGIPIGQSEPTNSAYMLNRAICLVADFVDDPPCHPDFPSLKALYAAADGGNWGVNWDTTANGNCAPCTWDGIQCNAQGRVMALDLSNKALNGLLPPEIGWLSELEVLRISNSSNLNGNLPSEIRLLQNLKVLDLSNNDFTGTLPNGIGNLVNLEKLFLSNNLLSGAIPRKIGTLPNLNKLDVSNNNLTDFLPSSFGILPVLDTLLINDNQLSGPLPKELANLSNTIDLLKGDNNNFSDCFPVEFSAFCGKAVTFSNNTNLQYQGDFSQFCANPNQSCNQQMCSHPDFAALDALFAATNGEYWNNNQGWLADCDPCQGIPWNGITCDVNNRVTSIFLGGNSLTGTLPPEIGQLTSLQTLWLVNNNLSGTIPAAVGQMTALSSLNLSSNNFTGTIPNEVGQLSNLTYLSLVGNDLVGPLPNDLINAPLSIFSINSNPNFTSCYPDGYDTFCNINFNTGGTMMSDFQAYCNDGTGACADGCSSPAPDYAALELLYQSTNGNNWTNNTGWLEDCDPCRGIKWQGITCNTDSTRVIQILLFNNNLNGTIPIEMNSLSHLEFLYLHGNNLTGTIPAELGDLTSLKELMLMNNSLSGNIPSSLGNLSNLQTLMLSDNNLDGCIPESFDIAFCQNEAPSITISLIGNNLDENDFSQFCATQSGSCAAVCHSDYDALTAFYQATNGDMWNNNTGWLSNCDPCGEETGNTAWQGIFCANNRVTGIALGGRNLTGSLPSEIGDLSELNFLNLTTNSLTGVIPTEIGNLSKLKWSLRLDQNQFTGSIPSELGNLSQLISLELGNNQLSGTLPPELAALPLGTFRVENNTNLHSCYPAGYNAFCDNVVDFSGTMLPSFDDFCATGTNPCTSNECPTMLVLAAASMEDEVFKAAETITSTDTVNMPHIISYEAGLSITMQPGFEVKAGATFTAKIADCSTNLVVPEVLNSRNNESITTLLTTDLLVDLKVYPNPFTTQTTIEFTLEQASPVQLQLLDLTGKMLKNVLPKSHYDSGTHQVILQNEQLHAGIYFIQLTSADKQLTRKVIRLR